MIPITDMTKSGIGFWTWTQRFIGRLELKGYKDGWVFKRSNGKWAKALDYQDNIFKRLEDIQNSANLIDQGCNIWDEFRI